MTTPMLPPPGPDEDLRTLFIRTALGNSSLMEGIRSPSEAVRRAVEIADLAILALGKPGLSSDQIQTLSGSKEPTTKKPPVDMSSQRHSTVPQLRST